MQQSLNEQLRLDNQLLQLLKLREKNGIGTKVDVLRQEAQVADSQTFIPLAEAELDIFENRLDVLMGQTPDGQHRVPKIDTLAFTETLPPIGVPASLLLHRPDLSAKRAELLSADADIATAIANRLPRITLTGTLVRAQTNNFSGPLASITGAFIQPLLDWGNRKAAVKRNKALYQERLADFTQHFIEAVEDVENALVQERKQREFLKRLHEQQKLLKRTVDVSEDLYKQGVADYFPVIDALQELRDIERALIDEQLVLVNIRIQLYRAIGASTHKRDNHAPNA